MGRLIGVLGGTFDPPHLGHLIPSLYALENLGLDEIRWVITPRSPLKPDLAISPAEVRARMVEAAISVEPRFLLSRFDLDRPPPHFAFETLEGLAAAEPSSSFVYLMGGDSLADLPRWREPVRLVEACHAIGVLIRSGPSPDLDSLDRAVPGLREKVRWIRAPVVAIAAREIRERVRLKLPIHYLVPEAVERILEAEGLYRERGSGAG